MSAKDKAIEIVTKYAELDFGSNNKIVISVMHKKQALIAVDEMLDFRNALYMNEGSLAHQWLLDVKHEIQLL
jgi:hypothetical protein